MRLVAINQSLWLDEAIGAIAARDFSYYGILTDFIRSDNHSPLYYLVLKAWTGIFGFSEISIRFPSILFGLGTIYLAYLIAKVISRKGNKFFPFLTALLIATSPFHIYYSQEARMYSMAAFFAALAIYSFMFLIKKGKNRRNNLFGWVIFSLSITSLVFTDYVPVFLLPVFWIYAAIKIRDKSWWFSFIFSHLPLLVLGILWLPTLFIQTQKGGWLLLTLPAWRDLAGGATFKQAALVWMKFVLGRISFHDKLFYYSLVTISSIPFALTGLFAYKERRKILLIWFWLVLPLILGFAASFWFPAFTYFRFLYVLPAFYLIISWGVSGLRRLALRLVFVFSIILINLVGWTLYITEPYQQREQWRQAVEFIGRNATSDDVVIFEFPEPFAPYRWYEKGYASAVGVTDSISANHEKTANKTKKAVVGKKGVYYFEYLRDLSDPQRVVETTLDDMGYKVVKVYDLFPGVGQVFYWERL